MKKFLRKSLLVVTLLSSSLVTSCYKESEQKAEEKKEEPKPTEQPSTPTPSQPQKVVISYVDGSETKTVEDPKELTPNTAELTEGFYVVKNQVTLSKALEVKGDVTKPVKIIVTDGATLNFGTEASPLGATALNGTGGLYIYGQTSSTGKINIFTKDVKDVVKVGQYIQKGCNVSINNALTEGAETPVELGSAIVVAESSLSIEKGKLELKGNYVNGLNAAGILVRNSEVNVTEANISGTAINSTNTFKTEKDATVRVSNVEGNGVVTTGDVTLEGDVEVSVAKTAIKSSTNVTLKGGKLVALTSAVRYISWCRSSWWFNCN